MMQQYQEILARPKDGPKHMYPHPCAWGYNHGRRRGWDDGLEWAAYHFCMRWGSRVGFNAKRLQRIVIESGNPEVAYKFARDVPGASIDKLERVVVEAGAPKWMWLYAKLPGARRRVLEGFAFIAETHGNMIKDRAPPFTSNVQLWRFRCKTGSFSSRRRWST